METSEFGHFPPQLVTSEKRCDPFIIDDLLDFSNHDSLPFDHLHQNSSRTATATTHHNDVNNYHHSNGNSDSSTTVITTVDSCNSSFSGNHDNLPPPPADIASHISSDLCIPYDDLAELEWLSHFVEDSFSSDDMHGFQFMSAMKIQPDQGSETRYYPSEPITTEPAPTSPLFSPEMPVPGKARSKRSRAAPCNWASRLLVLSPEGHEQVPVTKPTKPAGTKKKIVASSGVRPTVDSPSGSEVRKCLHCATDKTPQWRSGPMGPKTLCNACGVRYKSGRLVPEYRPAASPTFLLTKHSNSHRKVMELRRQKELTRHQHMQQHPHQQYQQQLIHHNPNNTSSMIFDPCHGDEYLIHQHIGLDFVQLI